VLQVRNHLHGRLGCVILNTSSADLWPGFDWPLGALPEALMSLVQPHSAGSGVNDNVELF
jgi:hypothetical protein